jgi:hypothetical protein
MQLRLPGRPDFIDKFLERDHDHHWNGLPDFSALMDDVDVELVELAIEQIGAGQIEYVGLNGDGVSIQAGQFPDGLVLERSFNDRNWVQHPGPFDAAALRVAFVAFHGGDVDAGLTWPEAPEVEEKPRRGLFRRKG